MRKLIYAINLTIDGCFDHTSVNPDDELLEYYSALLQDAGLLLYGRKTYQLMVPYWPEVAKNPAGETDADVRFARVFTQCDKVVVSRTLERGEEPATRIIRDHLPEETMKLKREPGKNILTGGVDLPSQLIEWGLVDEYYFVVHPVIAGEGRRLMEGFSVQKKLRLKLTSSRAFASGGMALHYRNAD